MSRNTLSKFNIIQGSPPALPGCCISCGTTQGPFIDWGMQLEGYGAVYLCAAELLQISNELGYHSPGQWKTLMEEKNAQYAELSAVRDENEQLLVALDTLANARSSNRSVTSDDTQTSTESEISTEGTGGTESESIGQNSESRSTDIYNDGIVDEILNI